MTPDEVARVLAKCAAYDQRTVGRADVAAWTEVLGDLDMIDALPAVTAHYRGSTRRAMPADIRDRAIENRDQRRRAEHRTPLAELPPGRHEDDPDRDARIAAGIARARAALPSEPHSDSVHRRAVARARQERGRPEPHRKQGPGRPAKLVAAPEPVDAQVEALAKRYLRDGWDADEVAERLGVSRKWCRKTARRLGALGPLGWCGQCSYETRKRATGPGRELTPCPDCSPTEDS